MDAIYLTIRSVYVDMNFASKSNDIITASLQLHTKLCQNCNLILKFMCVYVRSAVFLWWNKHRASEHHCEYGLNMTLVVTLDMPLCCWTALGFKWETDLTSDKFKLCDSVLGANNVSKNCHILNIVSECYHFVPESLIFQQDKNWILRKLHSTIVLPWVSFCISRDNLSELSSLH